MPLPRWTDADRVGRLSPAALRELRVRAIVSGEIDPDVHVGMIDLLDALLDKVRDLTGARPLVAEELKEALETIAEEAREKEKEAEETVKEAEENERDARGRIVDLEKDHDVETRALEATIRELRERVADLEGGEPIEPLTERLADMEEQIGALQQRVATACEAERRAIDRADDLQRRLADALAAPPSARPPRPSVTGEPAPARPFIKSAGGKARLAAAILDLVPEGWPLSGAYHEPFIGGGAVFHALMQARGGVREGRILRAHLGDRNPELVDAYAAVRDRLDELRVTLATHQENDRAGRHGNDHAEARAYYERVRAVDPASLSPVERAARFVYLNKTCFNGLWRVNRGGRFNVPFGRYKSPPTILDEENLIACSRSLAIAEIRREDFRFVLSRAQAGDLVYMDPPYLAVGKTADFTSYTADGFSYDDHVRLRDTAVELRDRGALVILSNADDPRARELYADGFEVHEVTAARAINSDGGKRGDVRELIIRGLVR